MATPIEDPDDLTARVRALVARERGMPLFEILLSMRLEEDLGMTGDDSAQFLEKFAAQFGVDPTGLEFHKHFGPEGCNPFWLFFTPPWLKEYGRYPVTVDHLVRVAKVGRWFSPPLVGSFDVG